MSDTNRTSIGVIKALSYNTIPSNPAFKVLRVNSISGFGAQPDTRESEEISSDRQVKDVIKVLETAAGSITSELSFEAFDHLLEGTQAGAWSNMPVITNTAVDTEITGVDSAADSFTVASGGASFKAGHLVRATGFGDSDNNIIFRVVASDANTITGSGLSLVDDLEPAKGAKLQVVGFAGVGDDLDATSTGLESTLLDFTSLGLSVGQWIKVGGSASGEKYTTAANNDVARITAITASALTLDNLPAGWDAEESAGSKTVKVWTGDFIRNGTTLNDYVTERQFEDHTPITYEISTGMVVNTTDLSYQTGEIPTISFNFLGAESTLTNTRTTGASSVAAPQHDVYDASSSVHRIAENGAAVSSPNYVRQMSMSINNNARGQDAVGSDGLIGVGLGSYQLTGSLETYFGDKTIAQKVKNNDATSLSVQFTDKNTQNQTMLFDMPRVKFTSSDIGVPGRNADVVLSLDYQALKHPIFGYTMHLQRFWYYE